MIDNFSHLKLLLGGSAANNIASFLLAENDYAHVIELLRIGRNDFVINIRLTKLLNFKPVRNTSNVKEKVI